ncbi:acylphosphatase [Palleronia sp. LCG004]|uniref:acylphosphatase n=1 Tax=Palleronia sp. LCG004 TaxID=3079304 RepID=UPI002943DDBE|nr:acylphosphatase [Palleronia sp. LCG004]WOI56956.1 acylphosphatase [Palleronia sp. LCG004]
MATRVFVSGRVQGVGFRAFARDAAQRHGVAGWVRNLGDGRVEAHLEGSADARERLIDVLRDGPPTGRVDDLLREERPTERCNTFEIRS